VTISKDPNLSKNISRDEYLGSKQKLKEGFRVWEVINHRNPKTKTFKILLIFFLKQNLRNISL